MKTSSKRKRLKIKAQDRDILTPPIERRYHKKQKSEVWQKIKEILLLSGVLTEHLVLGI